MFTEEKARVSRGNSGKWCCLFSRLEDMVPSLFANIAGTPSCCAWDRAWLGQRRGCAENKWKYFPCSVELLSRYIILSLVLCTITINCLAHPGQLSALKKQSSQHRILPFFSTVKQCSPTYMSHQSTQWMCSDDVESVFQHANEIRVLLSTLSLL